MSHGPSLTVPGPSLLLEQWPRDCWSLSQVWVSEDQYVPRPIIHCPRSIFDNWRMAQVLFITVPGLNIWTSLCPMAHHWLSQVHLCCLRDVPGTVDHCPRSEFLMISMSHGQSFIVPGQYLIVKGWPRYYLLLSQVSISECHYVPWPIIDCPRSNFVAWTMAQGLLIAVPGLIFWWSLCPMANHSLSLVHIW